MSTRSTTCQVGPITIGKGQPLTLIGGPCVLEDPATNQRVGQTLAEHCAHLGLSYIYKASFDKANRSSLHSARGPGLKVGLAELSRLRQTLGVPVVTDVHEPSQAAAAAEAVDMLQIPAFLVRQSDLVEACGQTGLPVNAKKGQFLAPAEMRHVLGKLQEAGCQQILLTERGTFFGYHRLVNDFIGIGDLMELGPPVCFDVTHSTQLPGGGQTATAGRPDRAALLARAAVAAGVPAIFVECHPNPDEALSDGSTVQPLEQVGPLLQSLVNIHQALAGCQKTPSTV